MRRFAELYEALDASTATSAKLAALKRYFAAAPDADAAWAVYFLSGGRPRQVVGSALLRDLACRLAGIDDWLFEASYQAVGDLAETIAHVLPPPAQVVDEDLAHWVEQCLLPLAGQAPAEQEARLREAFERLDPTGRFLFVKLIGGGFRVGVSRALVQRALAEQAGIDVKLVAQRMMGATGARAAVDAATYRRWISPHAEPALDAGQPFPFFLAHALGDGLAALGDAGDWLVEWKFDGIRAQLVRRAGQAWIWSRGEELVTDRYPEVTAAAARLPDGCVLDGELVVWHPGRDAPAPFAELQRRIGRKTVGRKLLADAPVRFVAYDLLERDGQDLRGQPQQARRVALEQVLDAVAPAAPEGATAEPLQPAACAEPVGPAPRRSGSLRPDATLRRSPLLPATDRAALEALRGQARALGFEGLMLKQRDARYGSGRTKSDGVWWKWKVDPLSVDGVLIYAQAGHGRRAGVYTDYTFAVWSRPPRDEAEAQAVVEAIVRREPAVPGALQLVPFAKAYSGLSDAEFAEVDREIRAHTLERFGPVRSVRPTQVFEIGFEGINRSPRHKSGIAVRFPRMLRIRTDKPVWQADSLDTLEALITGAAPASAG